MYNGYNDCRYWHTGSNDNDGGWPMTGGVLGVKIANCLVRNWPHIATHLAVFLVVLKGRLSSAKAWGSVISNQIGMKSNLRFVFICCYYPLLFCSLPYAKRRLRSASSLSLNVRRTRLSTVDDRAFPVAARTWISLPNVSRQQSACRFSVVASRLSSSGVPSNVVYSIPIHVCIFIYSAYGCET